MNLYLDDNHASPGLRALLSNAGHDVLLPGDANLAGASDARHFEYASRNGRVVSTGDNSDFHDLHELLRTSGGRHGGVFIVRFDNDPSRDMKPKHLVAAIRKLEQSGLDYANQIVILNHWR